MLSRRLTVTLSLFVVSLASCENQGKGVGTDVVVEICGYNREAIQAIGCMNEAGAEKVEQSEYYYQKCLMQHRVVEPRCRNEQAALAVCMREQLSGAPVATYTQYFDCQTADKTIALNAGGAGGAGGSTATTTGGTTSVPTTTTKVQNGNVTIRATLCGDKVTALSACSAALPANAP